MRKSLGEKSTLNGPACANCLLGQLCPGYSDAAALEGLTNAVVQRRRTLEAGAVLYQAGGAFSTVFVVYSGAIKAFDCRDDGHERVKAFFLPGELLGLDGFHNGVYTCNTMALVDTSVCELNLARIEELEDSQWEFVRVMSKVVADQKRRLRTNRLGPEERVLEVLRDVCMRLSLSLDTLQDSQLPMSHDDLAVFAGVPTATVEQVLNRLGSPPAK